MNLHHSNRLQGGDWGCDLVRVWAVAMHRGASAGAEGGGVRGDGFGVEYGGGISQGEYIGRGEEAIGKEGRV